MKNEKIKSKKVEEENSTFNLDLTKINIHISGNEEEKELRACLNFHQSVARGKYYPALR